MARLQNIRSLYQVNQASFDPFVINVLDEKYWRTELSGVVTTYGKSTPLSTVFSSLESARSYYPRFASGITSLTDQLDSCAIMEAYLDAVQIRYDQNFNGNSTAFGVSTSFSKYMGLKPALFIPRRYYRVTPDKVWFFGQVDILSDGAGFIGHDMASTGRNYFQYPSEGQEPVAGAVLTIGQAYGYSGIPPYVTYDLTRMSTRTTEYNLPFIFSDDGASWHTDKALEEVARGVGLRINGMYECKIDIPGIYGKFYCGVVVAAFNQGHSFNRYTLGDIGGPLINFKFCSVGMGTGSGSWITSNEIHGGNNLGPVASTMGNPLNHGICFDFDNNPSKLHNFPFPSGQGTYWGVGHLEIKDFHIENRHQATQFRLNKVSALRLYRFRGEAWNYPMYSGYTSANGGYGTTAIPRGPSIIYDMTDNYVGNNSVASFSSVKDVTIDNWHSATPYIECKSSSSNRYLPNPIKFLSRNFEDSTHNVMWKGVEDYYYERGSGPILTSTDGNKTFRLQMQTSGGVYSLNTQEMPLPLMAISISGTEDWQIFKDGVPYNTWTVPADTWFKVQPMSALTGTSEDFYMYVYRSYVDEAYDTQLEKPYYYSNNLAPFYFKVSGVGVYSFFVGNSLLSPSVSGLDPYHPTFSGHMYPPYNNRRHWYNTIYVTGIVSGAGAPLGGGDPEYLEPEPPEENIEE